MTKWTLLATVSFIAVLGVCYTMLSHQSARHGTPAPEAGDDMDLEDDGGIDKSENTFSLEDDAGGEGGSRVAALKSGPRAAPADGKKVETIEDDEENGVTVEAGEVLDDDDGVLEPAAPAPEAKAAAKPARKKH